MERDAIWVLEKLVLSNLATVALASILVFLLAFFTLAWNLPLKIVFTIPARFRIARIRTRHAQRRRLGGAGPSRGAEMAHQARDLSAELAELERQLNEIAFACSTVRRGRPPLGPRVLAAVFNREDVRAELRGSIWRALRNLTDEYYRIAALSDEETVRESGTLYQKWRESPVT